jgi:hypothetical protein
MTRNPIKKYNLRLNSERTNNPSSSLDGAHWNNDIDEDADNSANTTETFDPDLEYFIITILKGKKDDTRQDLNNGGIFCWEDFTLFNPDDTEYLFYKDGTEKQELPLLTQKRFKYAIFYYKWLIQENDAKVEFPRLWTSEEFLEWWRGSARQYIDGLTANAATDSFNSDPNQANPAMKSQQSKDDNNLNNWKKRGSLTKSDYPKLLNDSGYVAWKPRIIRRSKLDNWYRLIDPSWDSSEVRNGSNKELMTLQYIFLEEILDHTLQTQKGKSIVRLNSQSPHSIWQQHEIHQKNSEASRSAGTVLISELTKMRISEATSHTEFLEEFDTKVKTYAEIMSKPLADDVKTGFLSAAVSSDSKLLCQYSATQQMHIATGNLNTRVTYKSYIQHLQDYSSLEDKARPMRQRRHAHSARFEQEEASIYYDTSSEIMDVLANKSVSSDVIDNIRHIFASQREFKPRNPDADISKDLFISFDPEFRKVWSHLDEKSRIAILHCKAGTGKKNHELQV